MIAMELAAGFHNLRNAKRYYVHADFPNDVVHFVSSAAVPYIADFAVALTSSRSIEHFSSMQSICSASDVFRGYFRAVDRKRPATG